MRLRKHRGKNLLGTSPSPDAFKAAQELADLAMFRARECGAALVTSLVALPIETKAGAPTEVFVMTMGIFVVSVGGMIERADAYENYRDDIVNAVMQLDQTLMHREVE